MVIGQRQQNWINALRSGEYKQGTERLQNGGLYCCLGVACKVAEKDMVKVKYDGINIKNVLILSRRFFISDPIEHSFQL